MNLNRLLDDAASVRIESGRTDRAKLIYKLPAGVEPLPTIQRKGADGAMAFELRCASKNDPTKTVQDVLPPSIHPTTREPYRWIGDWTKLQELPNELLAYWRNEAGEGSGTRNHGCSRSGAPGPSRGELSALRRRVVDDIFNHLKPDMAYDDWLRVGMALRSLDEDWAFDAWDCWSANGAKYDPEEMASKWDSFGDEGAVTVASLVQMAKEGGWTGSGDALFSGPRTKPDPGRIVAL